MNLMELNSKLQEENESLKKQVELLTVIAKKRTSTARMFVVLFAFIALLFIEQLVFMLQLLR